MSSMTNFTLNNIDNINQNADTQGEVVNRPRERKVHSKSGLLLESVRLETFAFWNPSKIDAEQLARNGFYFTRTADQVRCALCKGSLGRFEKGDEAGKEHWRHFNHKCPFIKEDPTGNVPLIGSTDSLQQVYDFLKDYYKGLSKVVSINVSATAKFPEMNTTDARMKTFGIWPHNVEVNTNNLVQAGFFSLDAGDLVQCFHCGGCMFNWLKGDDPVRDHANFYPQCRFLQSKTNTPQMHMPNTVKQPRMLTENEANLLMHHPMAAKMDGVG
ncbi:unnamed protein product, partial [Meganyctiphanes norvegica]